MLKVSVIVPVYNPGSDIEECIASLLRQTMPADDYEVIFVDDGSTDATPARLDELASAHDNVHVRHTPNSGWPGRPRNIGLEMARGEFVYFVDNDDWVGRAALERLHGAALRHGSDLVIGKVVGHGKAVVRAMFERNRPDVALDWPPLLRLLTPHKLFRKSMLDEHAIRFPEGPRRLEDHVFVVHSYFHADRISVLADYGFYHWMARDRDRQSGASASNRRFDPTGYFENLREVLDVVEAHTEAGELRDRLMSHWYRTKMLGRVGGRGFLTRETGYNRSLYEEVRRLALERYDEGVSRWLGLGHRQRSRLLRDGDYDGLKELATFEAGLGSDNVARRVEWGPGKIELRLEAALTGEALPLAFTRRGSRMLWSPPPPLRGRLPEEGLDATEELARARAQVMLRSPRRHSEFMVPSRSELFLLRLDGDRSLKRPAFNVAAEVDVRKAAGGARLAPGEWEVHAVQSVAGFHASGPVMTGGGPRRPSRPLTFWVTPDGHLRRRPPLRRRLRRRLPRLAGLFRRARRRVATRAGR
jgi:poly(ribitol-phosphate) beta-N-acetylglucosaminyltransferase